MSAWIAQKTLLAQTRLLDGRCSALATWSSRNSNRRYDIVALGLTPFRARVPRPDGTGLRSAA
jgi:hypothetical protein